MNLKQTFTNYADSISPTKEQKDKIFMKAFNRVPSSINKKYSPFTSLNNKLKINIFTHFFASKIKSFGTIAVSIIILITIPIVYFNVSSSSNKSSLNIAQKSDTLGLTPNSSNSNNYNASTSNLGIKIDTPYNPLPRSSTPEDTKTQDSSRAKEQSADLSFESNDVRADYQVISKMITDSNGYIVSTSFSSSDSLHANIVMRIPSIKFQSTLNSIRNLKLKTISENISTIDKQNQLTETQSIIDTNNQKIKDLQTKLDQEKEVTKQENLKNQINFISSDNAYNQKNLDSIRSATDFSTITINVDSKSKNNDLIGKDWDSVFSTSQSIIIFWLQVLIWLIVPISIMIIIHTIIKRKDKKI